MLTEKRVQSTGKNAAPGGKGSMFFLKWEENMKEERVMGVRARFLWELRLTRPSLFVSSRLRLLFCSFQHTLEGSLSVITQVTAIS